MHTHTDKSKENKTIPSQIAQQNTTNDVLHFEDNRPQSVIQRKIQENFSAQQTFPVQKKATNTGLPNTLKSGIEQLSGYAMDDVKVHYNSNKPAQLQAHAFAQGTNIHLASGQEKHLPHEAWHVVQQKQGRVKPTVQMKSAVPVNTDVNLEREADIMGAKALKNGYATSTKKSNTIQQKTIPNKVIQRYKEKDASTYTLGGASNKTHHFTTQSEDPTLIKKKGKEYKIKHEIKRTNAKQGLLVSDDDTLAINKTTAHAKEFYAVDPVFNSANKKLKSVKSEVRLQKSGGLNLTTNAEKLWKIIPISIRAASENQQQEFANLVNHICIEMASGVMGNTNSSIHEAVFKNKDQAPETVLNLASGQDAGDPKVNHIATALTDSPKALDPKNIRSKAIEGSEEELPGRRYGIQAGNKQLDKKAKKLGVNQYASPDVGEGYATFSVAASNDKQIDYVQTGKEREILKSIWGYHFATVIAKSLDGKDTVTLENYNRKDDVFKQLSAIIDRMIRGNKNIFAAILDEVTTKKGDSRYEIRQKLIKSLSVARNKSENDAQSDFQHIMNTYNAINSWFFMMQGSGKGQSFHEQQSKSDAFVNPITLRVRPQDKEREKLRTDKLTKIKKYPNPPATLLEQPSMSTYASKKKGIVSTIQNAETAQHIRSAYTIGKKELANFIINNTTTAIVSLTQQSGAVDFNKNLQTVTQEKGILKKCMLAIKVGQKAHLTIEDQIQKLWIYQTEKRMKSAQSQYTVVDATRYLKDFHNYYSELK